MESNKHTQYPEDGGAYLPDQPQTEPLETPQRAALSQPNPVQSAPLNPDTSSPPDNGLSYENSHDSRPGNKYEPMRGNDPLMRDQQHSKRLSKKWQQRLYWVVPLGILAIVLVVLFEVYKTDFERWVSPLADWLRKREAWSWTLPVAILFVLSFPPLFGHEIVQLIVGLTYPLGIALGIACAGSILGEAGCFIVFKYFFTSYVEKKIATRVKWAAVARVAQQAGFRGVLVIRYSIVPPHLANPLFSCTGMKFWLYMTTVILSLPKSMVFVALGTPSSESSKGGKYAKVVAILVVVAITIFASIWIRKKMAIATEEIVAERDISQGEELERLSPALEAMNTDDTSYRGVANTAPHLYQNDTDQVK